MKPFHYFTLLIGFLLIQTSVQAQFQYIGVEGQIYGAGGNTSSFVTSFNYLKQFGRHGIGGELGLPIALDNPGVKVPIDTVGYDAGIVWKRQYLPYLGFRYRFFASNVFFIGVLANVGLMRERFFADRYFQFADTRDAEAIPPVYYDYVIRSPFFRCTFESGLVWNLGKLMYGTFHGRLGLQYTQASLDQFGAFQVSQDNSAPQLFVPHRGLGFTGGVSFGLGVKL